MKSRRTVSLTVALAATLTTVVWVNLPRSEPVIKGHFLTYWLYTWRRQSNEWPETLPAALAKMDDRSVEFLIQQLAWKPSPLVWKLNYLPGQLINIEPFHDRPDYRAIAANALGLLGPRATCAIPALEVMARRHNPWETESGTTARGAAIAALIRLRHESLETCVSELLEYSDPNSDDYWVAISFLGTNASSAVPLLVKAIETSSDDTVKCRAAGSLGDIHSQPELSVPTLGSLLTHTDQHVRWHALHGLDSFGGAAQPAWKALAGCLSDPDDLIREWVTNILHKIDPPAARQLGIKE